MQSLFAEYDPRATRSLKSLLVTVGLVARLTEDPPAVSNSMANQAEVQELVEGG